MPWFDAGTMSLSMGEVTWYLSTKSHFRDRFLSIDLGGVRIVSVKEDVKYVTFSDIKVYAYLYEWNE